MTLINAKPPQPGGVTTATTEAANIAAPEVSPMASVYVKGIGTVEVPDKATGDHKAVEMYAEDPHCDQCGNDIATLEEATAVYFNQLKVWKLTHRKHCAFDAIFVFNPKLARRAS